jgi:uncharacterized protein
VEAAVSASEAARAELVRLRGRFGPLMLFLSGGCCDGSSPLCLHEGELVVGPNDVLLGEVDGVPFYVDREQYERWNRPAFVLDVGAGAAQGFSLEGLEGVHFLVRAPGERCS